MAGGLLALAVRAGLSPQRAHIRLHEDAAALAPGGFTFRPSNSDRRRPAARRCPGLGRSGDARPSFYHGKYRH
jgi:hypothetical protein